MINPALCLTTYMSSLWLQGWRRRGGADGGGGDGGIPSRVVTLRMQPFQQQHADPPSSEQALAREMWDGREIMQVVWPPCRVAASPVSSA